MNQSTRVSRSRPRHWPGPRWYPFRSCTSGQGCPKKSTVPMVEHPASTNTYLYIYNMYSRNMSDYLLFVMSDRSAKSGPRTWTHPPGVLQRGNTMGNKIVYLQIYIYCILPGQPTMGWNTKLTPLSTQLFWTNAIGQIDDIYNTWFYCRSFYTPLGRAGTTAENE